MEVERLRYKGGEEEDGEGWADTGVRRNGMSIREGNGRLKSAYERIEDEKLKLKLTGGILVFEFVINLMRKEIDNWRIMRWVLIGVIIVRSM